jgi:methylmalonyl-CoA/ethylmalonyl-CoA epimerase
MEIHEIQSQSWKLMQVGVVVRNLDKAVERLQSFGFGPFESSPLAPNRQEWYRGKPFLLDVKISKAKLGDVQLELIQPTDGESLHKEYLDEKGEGIQHVMFGVNDFEKEVAALTEKGASVVLKAIMPGGRTIAYVDLNVGGLVVELVQNSSTSK